MKAVLRNKDTEACEVSSGRMLNHKPFYFHPAYKLASLFPHSLHHLSLISLSPLLKPQPNAKPSVLFRDGETHLTNFKVVFLCLQHLCFCSLLKCKCGPKNTETPESYLLRLIMWRIIFSPWEEWIKALTVFYVWWVVVPQWLQRLELSCILKLLSRSLSLSVNLHLCCAWSC